MVELACPGMTPSHVVDRFVIYLGQTMERSGSEKKIGALSKLMCLVQSVAASAAVSAACQ